MFLCFNLGGSDLERKARHDSYWQVLAGLPPYAVAAACHDAAKGNIGDGCFVPTAAMLYQRAVSYLPSPTVVRPLEPDRVISPDERERVAAGFAAFAKEMAQWKAEQEPERMIPYRRPGTGRPLSELVPGELATMKQLSKEALAIYEKPLDTGEKNENRG